MSTFSEACNRGMSCGITLRFTPSWCSRCSRKPAGTATAAPAKNSDSATGGRRPGCLNWCRISGLGTLSFAAAESAGTSADSLPGAWLTLTAPSGHCTPASSALSPTEIVTSKSAACDARMPNAPSRNRAAHECTQDPGLMHACLKLLYKPTQWVANHQQFWRGLWRSCGPICLAMMSGVMVAV